MIEIHSERFSARRHEFVSNVFLDAAERAIERRGISRVTMRDIADEAGCSAGTLYNYFRNKEEMTGQLLARYSVVVHPQIMKAFESSPDCVAVLRALLALVMDLARSHNHLTAMLLEAMPESAPSRALPPARAISTDVEKNLNEEREAMLRLIRLGQERNQIRRDIPTAEIAACCRAFGRIVVSAVEECKQPRQRPPERIWRLLVEGVCADQMSQRKKKLEHSSQYAS